MSQFNYHTTMLGILVCKHQHEIPIGLLTYAARLYFFLLTGDQPIFITETT
jgi:hypothetical protein